MRKSCQQLLESNRNKKIGNHKVEVDNEKNMRHFIYFRTEICTVDESKRQFTLQNGGWNTVSTTIAMNSYRYGLSQQGYKEVENFIENTNRRLELAQ